MKRHAVIMALKPDHGDLEIACFIRVARLFVHQICKELEKENDNLMSVSKHKKHFPHSDSMRTPEFIHKVKQTTDKTKVNQWGQLQKVACV